MRSFVVIGVLLAAVDLAWGADLPAAPSPVAPAVYAPPPPRAYDWTGIYAGANVGWGFANVTDTGTIAGGALGGLSASGRGTANGAVAGGQIGFNYQINAVVLGIEGDFDWSGLSSTANAGILSENSKMPWIATVRGRAGFAIDGVMLYGTGGVAFLDLLDNINAAGFGSLFSASSVNVGWTIGAGVEAALAQNWTVKLEYLFVQSDFSLNGPLALVGGNLSYSGTLSDNIIRAGVNFKYP
jgi:outer membrane immunogenic protein